MIMSTTGSPGNRMCGVTAHRQFNATRRVLKSVIVSAVLRLFPTWAASDSTVNSWRLHPPVATALVKYNDLLAQSLRVEVALSLNISPKTSRPAMTQKSHHISK